MKLYLPEKNLYKITKVSLAEILPRLEQTVLLSDGKDDIDKEKTASLGIQEDGAYLLICRAIALHPRQPGAPTLGSPA